MRTGKTFKRAFFAFTVFLIFVAVGTYVVVDGIEKQARQDVGNSLSTVLNTTHEAQIIWIEDNMDLLQMITSDSTVISLTEELLQHTKAGNEVQSRESLKKLSDKVLPKLHIFGHMGFVVIGHGNTLPGSDSQSDAEWVRALTEQRQDTLKRAFTGRKVFVLPVAKVEPEDNTRVSGKQSMMFFAGPIVKDGRTVAVFAIKVDPTFEFTEVTQVGRIGDTGESYAFDKDAHMITKSRFTAQLHNVGLIKTNENAMLNIHICDPGQNLLKLHRAPEKEPVHPLTFMAREATSGKSGLNVEGYRDYRGVRVLGAWLWDKDLGYGLTTEIDEAEALRSFYAKQYVIFALIGLTVVSFAGLMLIIYRLEARALYSEIKALKGLLPICSSCKKIRDDKGYWDQIETYIHERSEAEFSHSICPDCAEKLYPGNHLQDSDDE